MKECAVHHEAVIRFSEYYAGCPLCEALAAYEAERKENREMDHLIENLASDIGADVSQVVRDALERAK